MIWCRHEGGVTLSRNQGKIGPHVYTHNQNSTIYHQRNKPIKPLRGADFSPTPLSHSIDAVGWARAASRRSARSIPSCGGCRGIDLLWHSPNLTPYSGFSTKRQSTNDNSFQTSSSGDAESAMISMSRHFGGSWFAERGDFSKTPWISGGWRGHKLGWSHTILGHGKASARILYTELSAQTTTTKKHNYFRAVIHKDADSTHAFFWCHDAVRGDNQRPLSFLKYQLLRVNNINFTCVTWMKQCDIALKFDEISKRSTNWSRPLTAWT